MQNVLPDSFDAVYFDPMFRFGVKTSANMKPLRPLAYEKEVNAEIIELALKAAPRVVIKERSESFSARPGLHGNSGRQVQPRKIRNYQEIVMKKQIAVILGPTATGKSHCGIALAQALDGEIISGDSMLVYRGMDIGTAKPTAEELAAVPHHMVDILPPDAGLMR